jgi:signal peptidase I
VDVSEDQQTSVKEPEQERVAPEQAPRLPARLRLRATAKALFVTVALALILKMFVVEAFRIPSGSMENTLLVGDFLLVNKLAYGLKTPRYLPLTTKAIPSVTFPAFRTVRRGDVLVFEYPGKRGEVSGDGPLYFIKRCIGLPGDTVAISGGTAAVNGREVLMPMYAKSVERWTMLGNQMYGPVVVPRKGEAIQLAPENAESWREFLERERHSLEVASDGRILIDGIEKNTYLVEKDYYFVLGDNRGNSLDSRVWGFVPEDAIIGEALLVYWSWNPEVPEAGRHANAGNIRWDRIGMLIR